MCAQRRMFSRAVVTTDLFLKMSHKAQSLYFQLGMWADDDGFVDKPLTVLAMTGCSRKELQLLEEKNLILTFPSGVCVIRDWRVNNLIKKDRYQETPYEKEKGTLTVDRQGHYVPVEGKSDGTQAEPMRNQNGTQAEPQDRIGKDRSEKDRIEREEERQADEPPRAARFTAPTMEEVSSYCQERRNRVDAERFVDFYTSKGWRVGNQPMKDWRSAVRTWEKRDAAEHPRPFDIRDPACYTYEEGESL